MSKDLKKLIGKKAMIINDKEYEGLEWEIIRIGLFKNTVDLERENHMYLEAKIKNLQIL